MLSMVGLEAKIMKKRTILKVKYDKIEYGGESYLLYKETIHVFNLAR